MAEASLFRNARGRGRRVRLRLQATQLPSLCVATCLASMRARADNFQRSQTSSSDGQPWRDRRAHMGTAAPLSTAPRRAHRASRPPSTPTFKSPACAAQPASAHWVATPSHAFGALPKAHAPVAGPQPGWERLGAGAEDGSAAEVRDRRAAAEAAHRRVRRMVRWGVGGGAQRKEKWSGDRISLSLALARHSQNACPPRAARSGDRRTSLCLQPCAPSPSTSLASGSARIARPRPAQLGARRPTRRGGGGRGARHQRRRFVCQLLCPARHPVHKSRMQPV